MNRKNLAYIILLVMIFMTGIILGEVETKAATNHTLKMDVDYRVQVRKSGGVSSYYDVTLSRNSFLKIYKTNKKTDKAIKKFIHTMGRNICRVWFDFEYVGEYGDYEYYAKVKEIKKKKDVIYKISYNMTQIRRDEYESDEDMDYYSRFDIKRDMFDFKILSGKRYAFSSKNLYIQPKAKEMGKDVAAEMCIWAGLADEVLGKSAKKTKLKINFAYVCKMPYKVKKTNGRKLKSNPRIVSYDYSYKGKISDFYDIGYKKFSKFKCIFVSTNGKSMKQLRKYYHDYIEQKADSFSVVTEDYKKYIITNKSNNRKNTHYEYYLDNNGDFATEEEEEDGINCVGPFYDACSSKEYVTINLRGVVENKGMKVKTIDEYGNPREFRVTIEKKEKINE